MFRIKLFLALFCLFPVLSFAATGIDYRTINVDQDYSQADYNGVPLYYFTPQEFHYTGLNPVFPTSISLGTGTATPTSFNVTYYLTLQTVTYQGQVTGYQLLYAHNITEANFATMSSACSTIASLGGPVINCYPLNGDPNILVYDFAYTGQSTTTAGAAGDQYMLPIIVNNGVRARTVDELVAARNYPGEVFLDSVKIPPLDYFQISSNVSDFTGQNPTPIVSLADYFSDPSGSTLNYFFDAASFCLGYTGTDASACTDKPVAYLYDASATAQYPTAEYFTPVPTHKSLHGSNDLNLSLPNNVKLTADCSDTSCSISATWDQPGFASGQVLQFSIYDPVAESYISQHTVSESGATGNSANISLIVSGGGNYQILLTPGTDEPSSSNSYIATDFSAGGQPTPTSGSTEVQLVSSSNPDCDTSTNKPTFYIGDSWGSPTYPSGYTVRTPYLYGKNLCPGIYQVNVTAVGPSPYDELAHATFYVNVSDANNQPSLSTWLSGADEGGVGHGVPTTNLLAPPYKTKPFIPIYIYAGGQDDPKKDLNSFLTLMGSYNDDIQYLNGNSAYGGTSAYFGSSTHKISDVLSEVEDLQFENNSGTWPVLSPPYFNSSVSPNGDPKRWIGYGGINIVPLDPGEDPAPSQYMPQLTGTFTDGVGFIPDYGWNSDVKVFMNSANETEIDDTAQLMAQLTFDYANSPGASLDLEAGLNAPPVVQWFKALADRLAYRGRTFSAFDFAYQFPPQLFAAMGPLGIELISEYDAGAYRAPKTTGHDVDLDHLYGYEEQGWSSTDAQTLYNIFNASNVACTVPQSSSLAKPISWCSLTAQDQIANNNNNWQTPLTGYPEPSNYNVSPQEVMTAYNAQFVPILAVSAAATSRDYVELWYPDLSDQSTESLPNVLRDLPECAALNNAWFAANDTAIDQSGSAANTALKNCLFSSVTVGGQPVQSFKRCGYEPAGYSTCVQTAQGTIGQGSPFTAGTTPCPYHECILISALPGSIPTGTSSSADIQPGGDAQFIEAFTQPLGGFSKVYAPYDQHMLGYGFFALEATEGSQAWGETNGQQAESWYAGGPNLTEVSNQYQGETIHYDPFYFTDEAKTIIQNTWAAGASAEDEIFSGVSAQSGHYIWINSNRNNQKGH